MRAIALLAALVAAFVVLPASHAASPALSLVTPRGGQRGTDVHVTIQGQRLADAREVVLLGPGITVRDLENVDATRMTATFAIAGDCPPGLHGLRVRTAGGITNIGTFSVGALPEVAEVEPNNAFDAAQAIALDVTVNGVAHDEDVDYYAVEAKSGERITAEVEGLRISRAPFDPSVAIYDDARFELASSDDAALVRQDAFVSIIAPRDGRYVVQVRESSYRGNGNCRYRLHVGRFPRPTATIPCGGPAGVPMEVRLLGDPTGERDATVTFGGDAPAAVDATAGWTPSGVFGAWITDDRGVAPSPNFFRVSDLPNVIEHEPNNGHANATPLAIPAAGNGVIGAPGDRDCYAFTATKGQVLEITVFARRVRSSLDAVIGVSHRGGKYLVGNDDDAGAADSRVRFTAPADGEFIVLVRDHLNGGAPDMAYRVEIAPPRPTVSVTAPRTVQAVPVPAGNRATLVLSAQRSDFGGPLAVAARDLPAGVVMHAPPVHEQATSFPVVFEAAPGADLAAALAAIDVRHADASTAIHGGYRQDLDLVLGRNRVVFWAHSVDRLPIAVTEPAPFSIEVTPPGALLVRNGQGQLHVVATRAEGFAGAIRLRVPFRPPGVGASNAVTIAADQTEALIPINANGNAPPRTWHLVVTGESGAAGGGRHQVSSSLVPLEISPPFLAFRPQATTVEQGGTTTMHVEIVPQIPLEGPVRVELARLPHHVKAAPVEIAADATSFSFSIETAADSPPGRHRNLFCVATCTRDGEPVVHRLPAGELRIDKPLPAAVAAAAPPPPPAPAPSAERPPTRLEKLRLEHARRRGEAVAPEAAFPIRRNVPGAITIRPAAALDAERETRVSFRRDVMPIFTAAGCSTGACHGSARGQDGFRLSLFGFDPDGDYERITRELPGRRIDLAFPERSLLLEKATRAVPHSGGELFEPGSDFHDTIRRWIVAGAPRDEPGVPSVTGIALMPDEAVLAGAGERFQLVVRASYSDGTDRDVTRLAVFRTSNETSARVEPGGLVTSGAPGEAFLTASFDTFTEGVPFVVLTAGTTFDYVDPADAVTGAPPASFIDAHVAAKLKKLRMNPSALCDDDAFLRRASLDLVGLLPTPAEQAAFVADARADKRAILVDRLLERKEFAELWVMQWAELLQIRSNNTISPKAALRYFEWVRAAIEQNVPIDEMVRRILTATGGTFGAPASNFYLNQPDTLVLAENVAQAFMGIRVQWAQCHNHPFDRWTQDDYYGFAAFFARIARKRGEDPRETIVFSRNNGEVKHPVGGRVMTPKFLGGAVPDVGRRDRRAVAAEWLTAPDNPFFARSFANRVWAHFMGVGIVDPPDDFRVSNPPSNGPLLDALATRLVAYEFDFKRLVRDICTSRTYQRATQGDDTNERDDRNFAHALVRRLRAEVLSDVVAQVTEQPEKFGGLPLGARAVEIADGSSSNYFLTTFGRAPRDTVCTCEVSREPSLSQALHLLNGATVNRKIEQGGVVRTMLGAGATFADVIDALARRCFCRALTATERAALIAQVQTEVDAGAEPAPVLEDVFWAMLNSREFIFNH